MNIFLSNICFYMEYENGSGWGIWTHQSEDYETSVLAIAPTRNNEIKMVGVTGFEPALSSPQTRSETSYRLHSDKNQSQRLDAYPISHIKDWA